MDGPDRGADAQEHATASRAVGCDPGLLRDRGQVGVAHGGLEGAASRCREQQPGVELLHVLQLPLPWGLGLLLLWGRGNSPHHPHQLLQLPQHPGQGVVVDHGAVRHPAWLLSLGCAALASPSLAEYQGLGVGGGRAGGPA